MALATATQRDTKLDRLGRQPLLAGCSASELERVGRVFDTIDVAAGGVLLQAGPLARWFVLIDDGVADVMPPTGVALVHGDACGDASLSLHDAQVSAVTARTDVRAFVAGGRELLGIVSDIPALARGPLGALVASRPAPPRPAPRRSAAPPRPAFRAELVRPQVANSARKRTRWVWPTVACGLLALAVLGAARYHPAVVMLSPGRAVDITHDVTISGAPVYPVGGRYLMTPVRLSRPSLLAVAMNKLRGNAQVVAWQRGGDHVALRRAGRAEFNNSRDAAAAAVAGSLGVPFTAQFRPRDIVGPSAGLVYALLLSDLLRPGDQSGGRAVAATGTIDADGAVGPIGDVREKLVAARRAHAALMFLPATQVRTAGDIPVIGVASLRDAMDTLDAGT